MYRDIAKLVLYRDLGEDSILMKLSGIFEDFDMKRSENAELCARIYDQKPGGNGRNVWVFRESVAQLPCIHPYYK